MLTEKIQAIEDEFGEPFVDVIRGFADMGYSRKQVAEILEIPAAQFARLCDRDYPDIEWPVRGRYDNDNERRGADVASAISLGRIRSGKRIRFITYRDRTMPISYWDRQIGAAYRGVVAKRIANGWDIEAAVTTPVRRQDGPANDP